MKRKKKDADPIAAAVRLATILPPPCALIGGLAVGAHGYVRATDDVDIASPLDPKAIQAALSAAGIGSTIRRGNVLEGEIRSVVSGTLEGVDFDVLFPPVLIPWETTVTLTVSGAEIHVVALDDLLRLKLRAGGPQDLLDVVHLLRLHPEKLSLAREVATAQKNLDRLDAWLADPRIRAAGRTKRRR